MPPKGSKRVRAAPQPAEASAQKRVATGSTVQPAPKISPKKLTPRPQTDVVSEKCSITVKALEEGAQGIPVAVLKMMCDMVPGSLGEMQSQRHAHQHKVVEMIEKELESIERDMQKQVSEAKLKIKEGDEEQAAIDAAIAAAEVNLARRTEAHSQHSAALTEACAALQKAKKASEDARTTQQQGDAVIIELEGRKTKLKVAVKEEIDPMKAGTMQAGEVSRRVPALVSLLQECKFDEAMVAALPAVFTKEPSARSFFDSLVLGRLDECVYEGVTALESKIQEGEPGRCERKAAVIAAQAAESTALSKQKAILADATTAHMEQKQAQSALDAKQRESRELMPELCKRAARLNDAQSRLDTWRNGPRSAFKDLQVR